MTDEGTTKDALVERLARLDTCAVSDALDRLGLVGAVTGLRPMWPCPRIAGRAVTVKLKPIVTSDRPTHHPNTAAVDSALPGNVIVVDHSGRTDVGGWGGILSVAAKVKGVSGVVINGACRDVDESRDVAFPVYARAAVPVTGRGRIVEDSFNEPIRIEGVTVSPGDLVIADWSGVVFVASTHAEDVIRVAEEIARRELEMAQAVRAGRSVVAVMGAKYESLVKH